MKGKKRGHRGAGRFPSPRDERPVNGGGRKGPHLQLSELHSEGVRWFKRGDHVRAERSLKRVLAWCRSRDDVERGLQSECLNILGTICMGQRRFGEAVRYFGEASELDPDNPDTLNNLGVSLERTGDLEGAALSFEKVLRLRGNDPQVKKRLGRVKERLGRSGNTISLCMIVRDEEHNIRECLKSFSAVADEMIVVDTGSGDRTREMAAEAGAKVFDFPWIDDFAAARNESLDHATGDLILWADADDRIEEGEARKLREFLKGSPPVAVDLILCSLGSKGEEITSYQLRVFPNHMGVRFEGRVHEQVGPSLKRLAIDKVRAEITILHTGYTDEELYRRKAERNARIIKEMVEENPEDLFSKYNLSRIYQYLEDMEGAVRLWEEIISRSEGRGDHWIYTYTLLHLASYCGGERDYEKAEKLLKRAIKGDSEFFLGRHDLGLLYFKQKRYEKALKVLEPLREFKFVNSYLPLDMNLLRYNYHCCLGRCYEETGMTDNAARSFEEAMGIRCHSRLANLLYGDFQMKSGRLEEAEKHLRTYLEGDEAKGEGYFKLGKVFLMKEEPERAAEHYTRALGEGYDHPEAHCNLGIALSLMERYSEAEKELLKALDMEPASRDIRSALIRFYMDRERFDDAARFLLGAEKREGSPVTARLSESCLALMEGDVDRFLSQLNRAIEGLGLQPCGVIEDMDELMDLLKGVGEALTSRGEVWGGMVTERMIRHLTSPVPVGSDPHREISGPIGSS